MITEAPGPLLLFIYFSSIFIRYKVNLTSAKSQEKVTEVKIDAYCFCENEHVNNIIH